MKRLLAAAVLLVFVIVSYLSGYFYVKNVCKETEILLNKAVESYQTGENISENFENLSSFWHKKEKILIIFANHDVADRIEKAINSLSVLSGFSSQELFYKEASELYTILNQIREDTAPTMHNIL